MTHYYCNNCYLTDSTKCINLNKIASALLNTIAIIQCCHWRPKVIAIHQLLKSRILHVLNMWHKIDLKSSKLVKDNFPYIQDLSISLPSPSSSKRAMDVTSILRCSREGPTAGLYWHIIHGSRLYISLRQIFYLDEDLHYWKLDESFCSPWKAELWLKKKISIKNFIRI